MDRVRIGNGCGFWGDNLDAPILLAQEGRLDYLTLEYLAELTMSILGLQKQRDPQSGYATDFLDVLSRLCPILRTQPRLKIITNAGGMNPTACAAKACQILAAGGLTGHKVAVVRGDDLLPQIDDLLRQGHLLANLDTGEPLEAVRSRLVSANAYLGAPPLVECLRLGASVVITGRVADASLTVAPAVHELGWSWDNWDLLCAATVAGHLIECGAQATGGLWINWDEAPDLANVGYPLVEIEKSGTFRITKPEGSGGAVNRETISEQLLYEVGDPAAYLTPDVIADFTTVALREVAEDMVEVSGARGKPASESYKVSCAYRDGWMSSGTLLIYGPEARYRAERCGQIVLDRLRRAGVEPEAANIEVLGAGAATVRPQQETDLHQEVVLRVAVRDARREVVERFTKELAPLVTSGLPGVTGYTTGRPPVREVFAYWPALIDKAVVRPIIEMVGEERHGH